MSSGIDLSAFFWLSQAVSLLSYMTSLSMPTWQAVSLKRKELQELNWEFFN